MILSYRRFLSIFFVLIMLAALSPIISRANLPPHSILSQENYQAWWDPAWPYRLRVEVSGEGIAHAEVNFTSAFDALGLNHALLDLHSIRIIPDDGGTPGSPIPYAESYTTMVEDADTPQIGWHPTGFYWQINDDGYAISDVSRFTQGSGSLKAVITNTVGGYGYPGVELKTNSDPNTDWSPYEVFLYDTWPQVNPTALDQAPDLYWYKLYNACGGNSVTQGGPPLALDRWNFVSISLNPLDNCWPADGLDLSDIIRMEFHTRDNDSLGVGRAPSGLWDDGDVLTLWFDNMRLLDQDQGSIRWQTLPGVSVYYLYFDTLLHEGHPLPQLELDLGPATLTGTLGPPETGGYFHQITGLVAGENLQIWTAPTIEKIQQNMVQPVVSKKLGISAARGEFEAFQIIIQSPTTASLPVDASDFTMNGAIIPTPAIHRVEYVNITTAGDHFDRFGPWPDPLFPIEQGDLVTFLAGVNQSIWFTIQVPWDAPAGIYTGTVMVGSTTVPVEIQVWDFSLPTQIHLPSEWGFSWSSIMEIYRATINGSVQPCYWDVVNAFKQDFIDHRLIPKGVAWPAGLNTPGGIEYDCDTQILYPDSWGDWDFATLGGKYIHGESGFNWGVGYPEFLAFGPSSNSPPDSLPAFFCGVSRSGVLGTSDYQHHWTGYLHALDTYIVSDDYQGAYYHIVNEPQTLDDYDIVGQISASTETAAPHLRQLISEQVEPEIYGYPGAKIDIWMPTISNYEPQKSHERQQHHGEEIWWYYLYGDNPPLPNPILMSHHGSEARIIPWLAWNERVDGLLHYSTTDWSPNPWIEPNVTGKDNGDGFFFYPPQIDGNSLGSCGENGNRLVPSIRWENLRDGMEDYEYLWLLAGGNPQVSVTNLADIYVAQLVDSRTRFSRIPTDFDAVRAAIAAEIQGYSNLIYLPLVQR